MKGYKLFIVMLFVGTGIFFAFKGRCSESLNGIIAGIALIEAFVIYNYEADIEDKRRKVK
jgi:hypothetical protein